MTGSLREMQAALRRMQEGFREQVWQSERAALSAPAVDPTVHYPDLATARAGDLLPQVHFVPLKELHPGADDTQPSRTLFRRPTMASMTVHRGKPRPRMFNEPDGGFWTLPAIKGHEWGVQPIPAGHVMVIGKADLMDAHGRGWWMTPDPEAAVLSITSRREYEQVLERFPYREGGGLSRLTKDLLPPKDTPWPRGCFDVELDFPAIAAAGYAGVRVAVPIRSMIEFYTWWPGSVCWLRWCFIGRMVSVGE